VGSAEADGSTPADLGPVNHPIPAHPGERRDPGLPPNLVPACSPNPVDQSKPFLDPDFRRDERNTNIPLSDGGSRGHTQTVLDVYLCQRKEWHNLHRTHRQPRRTHLAAQNQGVQKGFTEKYDCDRLVWCEAFNTRQEAFARERQLKEWRRSWKIKLIERTNPDWNDLYDTISMWG
jgi:predicted GIY-YIG superfamily endonuclease